MSWTVKKMVGGVFVCDDELINGELTRMTKNDLNKVIHFIGMSGETFVITFRNGLFGEYDVSGLGLDGQLRKMDLPGKFSSGRLYMALLKVHGFC